VAEKSKQNEFHGHFRGGTSYLFCPKLEDFEDYGGSMQEIFWTCQSINMNERSSGTIITGEQLSFF